MRDADYREVLGFWFGEETEDAKVIAAKSALWWEKDAANDREIRNRFEELYREVSSGGYEGWRTQPEGRLALIIVTDQFSRTMYRETPTAFATDPLALELAIDGIESGMDRTLRPIERSFFYMPFEHSESLEMQERSMALFRQLADEVPVELKASFNSYIDFALRHYEIIQRFGRFPHRNSILGRQSTPAEITFLAQPGSSF